MIVVVFVVVVVVVRKTLRFGSRFDSEAARKESDVDLRGQHRNCTQFSQNQRYVSSTNYNKQCKCSGYRILVIQRNRTSKRKLHTQASAISITKFIYECPPCPEATVQGIHFWTIGLVLSHRGHANDVPFPDEPFLAAYPFFTARRYAERGMCYGNSVRLSLRPSVCLSVRHTGGSVKNG